MSSATAQRKITVPWVRSQKGRDRLTMLAAYDYPTARILDEAGIEMILVGDSLGNVLYGEPNTLSVTMEDMIRHSRAVVRGATHSLLIGDMPFMSYQVSVESALHNAGRFLKEAGVQAVKLEGGLEVAPLVKRLVNAAIPVMAHVGLMPQSIHHMGSYRVHGKTAEERAYILESALELQQAGAFSIVLECVVPSLAQEVTDRLTIPTIGIGSGSVCDGEVLVLHDLIGLTAGPTPSFVKKRASVGEEISRAVKEFYEDVKAQKRSSSVSTMAIEGEDRALSH